MISISTVILLLTLHFIGDFLLQSDWMALNKSRDWRALLCHVYIYTIVLLYAAPDFYSFHPNEGGLALWMLLVFLTHFLTDMITSQWTSKLWFIDMKVRPDDGDIVDHIHGFDYPFFARILDAKRHWFFVVIGLDQLIHIVTLVLLVRWLL